MAKNRKWGSLSKTARNRAARAGERYGLSRDAVRARYNRGTYNPLARDPVKRLPRELQGHATDTGQVDWQDLARDKMLSVLSDYYKFNSDRITFNVSRMNDDVAELVAMSTENEILAWASMQPDAEGNPPPIEDWPLPPGFTLEDVSLYDADGNWYNIFWYH
jgi:hypothetical protein